MVAQNTAAAADGSDPRRLLLSTDLASRGQKRFALVVATIAILAFLAAVPFVRVPLAKMPAFIPSYEAALFFIDLITAILLFDQFIRLRSVGLLFLASGYLFDALIIVAHALSFPGAFAPGGLLGGGPQTTVWLYVFWHGGFSLFVIGYALWGCWEDANGSILMPDRIKPAIIGSVLVVAALTLVLVLLATWGHDRLPVAMQGSDYSLLVTKGISPAVWVLTLLGMILLYRREQRVMDLWLMLVMWIWLFDIGLSAVIGSTRFDLGFYAGRIFGLIASAFLLVALVVETIQLYSRALGAAATAEQKLAQLKRTNVAPETKHAGRKGGEPVEQFVRRQNIERYRAMLKSQALDAVQRQTIEKLLGEEEAKYRDG